MLDAIDNHKHDGFSEAVEARQFILFRVGGEGYALPLSRVQEIVRVTPMAPVPLAPACLLGLANLRGKVLPVVSMRRAFAQEDGPASEANRVLVFDQDGVVTGLLVDQVSTIVTVDPAEVESAASIQHSVDSDLLLGVVKAAPGRQGEHMILDAAALLEGALGDARAAMARRSAPVAGESRAEAAAEDGSAEEEICLVSFDVDGQEYALVIDAVREIVSTPERVSQAPQAHEHLIGVATLRGELLPLVSLRRMFGAAEQEAGPGSKVVVARRGVGAEEVRIGLVADHVREVLRAPASAVNARPEAIALTGAGAQIRSICHFDGGERVVTVLDIDALCRLDPQDWADPAARAESAQIKEPQAMDQTEEAGNSDEAQFVVFKLGDEHYGAPISAVQEIVRRPEKMTRVPQTPDFVEGVVNLRGGILPVIDTRQWFGVARAERAERQRIIVLQIGGQLVGFVVDAVSEVKRVPRACIGPAPSSFGARSGAIREVAQLPEEDAVILLLNVEALLDGERLSAIAA